MSGGESRTHLVYERDKMLCSLPRVMAVDHYQPQFAQTDTVVLVCYQTARVSTVAANHKKMGRKLLVQEAGVSEVRRSRLPVIKLFNQSRAENETR